MPTPPAIVTQAAFGICRRDVRQDGDICECTAETGPCPVCLSRAEAMLKALEEAGYMITAPKPPLDEVRQFLLSITAMVNRHDNIPSQAITKLKELANWADVPPPPRWDGSYNREEIKRAIADAYARLDRTSPNGA